jgi:hypothetical protein
MGSFLNEFLADSQALLAVIVLIVLALPVFGYFYNQLMNSLSHRGEHTSLYVVGGVAVTLIAGSLLSWKAGLLFLGLFGLSGLPMIAGEFRRTEQKKRFMRVTNKNQRKRLPYAANAFIEDAHEAAREAQRLLDVAMRHNLNNPESAIAIAHSSQEMSKVISRLVELKLIQGD